MCYCADDYKISVIIPAYNAAEFIVATLDSVFQQSVPVLEVIVIDDGSQDQTCALVKDYPESILLIEQANAGPSAARNNGINIAKGNWVAFLDADDLWHPDKLALQLSQLSRYPDLVLSAGDMAEISIDGALLEESVLAKHQLLAGFEILSGQAIPNALAKLMTKNFIPTGTVMVKTAVLQELGGFNQEIRFGEDLLLWARIASLHPIACCPNVLMLRRRHQGNASNQTEAMLIDLIKVNQLIRAECDDALKRQGLDADKLVAQAYFHLAYYLFNLEQFKQSQLYFIKAMQNSWQIRFVKYIALNLLPDALLKWIRKIYQM